MSSRVAWNAGIVAASLLLSLGIVEVTLRHLADADGTLVVRGRLLGREHLPIVTTRRKIEAYLQDEGRAALAYDPSLGWAPRPNATSSNGLYHYNAQTIRAPHETARTAPAGTMRIALFGDSFIHGDDVGFDDSISAQLEGRLRAAGLNAEVLNFGVPGYGIDQAFLRWQRHGRMFAPQIVIQGLFMEDVRRNVNLIRPIYMPRTGIPFSKPRFVLQGSALVLVNVPALPPAEVVPILEDFSSWELAPHEYFFAPYADVGGVGQRSRALGLLLDSVIRNSPSFDWSLSGEPARVTQRLFEQYAKEVRETGATFLVLHLPDEGRLQRRLEDRRSGVDELLDAIAEQVEVISPEETLLAAARRADVRSLFGDSHYTGRTNALVADVVAARLRPQPQ